MMIPVAILWGHRTERCFQSDTKYSREKHTARPNYTLKGELLGFYAQLEGLSLIPASPMKRRWLVDN